MAGGGMALFPSHTLRHPLVRLPTSQFGETAMDLASFKGHAACIEVLQEAMDKVRPTDYAYTATHLHTRVQVASAISCPPSTQTTQISPTDAPSWMNMSKLLTSSGSPWTSLRFALTHFRSL